MSITIEDIKILDLCPGQILVMFCDMGNLPPQRQNTHLDNMAQLLRPMIRSDVRILVMPKDKYSFGIIDSLNFDSKGKSNIIDPSADYERAMSII